MYTGNNKIEWFSYNWKRPKKIEFIIACDNVTTLTTTFFLAVTTTVCRLCTWIEMRLQGEFNQPTNQPTNKQQK